MDGDLGNLAARRGGANRPARLEKAFDHGFRNITTRTKPIVTPDDLHGIKIRLPVAPYLISLFRSLGASPTAINFSEVYSALQTGVVDGQENPLQLIDDGEALRGAEVFSITRHVWVWISVSVQHPRLEEAAARHPGHWLRASSVRRRWRNAPTS